MYDHLPPSPLLLSLLLFTLSIPVVYLSLSLSMQISIKDLARHIKQVPQYQKELSGVSSNNLISLYFIFLTLLFLPPSLLPSLVPSFPLTLQYSLHIHLVDSCLRKFRGGINKLCKVNTYIQYITPLYSYY